MKLGKQNEVNKEIETITKHILELKTTMTKLKTLIESYSRLNQMWEGIHELELRSFETVLSEEQKLKNGKKKSEESLQDLWDTITWNNICIMRIPEGSEKGTETLFKVTMAICLSNLGIEKDFWIYEAQEIPNG